LEIKVKEPILVKGILSQEDFAKLREHTYQHYLDAPADTFDGPGFGRYHLSDAPWLTEVHEKLWPLAKELFGSETLKPAWYQLGIYEGPKAHLDKHVDDNACQYTIDICIVQRTQWPIWVEGKEYKLEENDAVVFYGNAQEHWRETFPDPMNNVVANLFMFYCEPDHWIFTEGMGYMEVIRKHMTVEEWNQRKQ
jgi:hypothetical protein